MHPHVGDALAAGQRRVPGLAAVDLGPVDDDLAADHRRRPGQRLLEEVGRLEQHVGDAEVEGLLGPEHAVLVQRVLDDDRDRLVGADQVGQQLGAAPARDQAEEHLGERDRRHAGGQRAVVAVQGELQAAAHDRAVDEGERRDRRVAQLAERVVPEREVGLRLRRRAARLHHLEVGADREDERLAGDRDRDDVVAAERLVDGRADVRPGSVGPERRRLGVVEAVVERDQGSGAGALGQVDVRTRALGDDLVREVDHVAHCGVLRGRRSPSQCGFSQMTAPPMPMPTHMAVRP